MTMLLVTLLVSLCVLFATSVAAVGDKHQLNEWPIIGVFTQPSSSTQGNCNGNCMYLAASYVKYLEAAGARVVPIDYNASPKELDRIFAGINGLFFPGGGAVYPSSAQYMFDKVITANDKGDFFPLWGTCMGFQWLLIAATRDVNVLDPPSGQMDAYNISLPLEFTPSADKSRLFSQAPQKVFKILGSENVTMNNHHYGIYPEHFQATPALTSMYNVLSLNKDRKGVEFVSTMEAWKYPIYGTQWHPEKNDFEWGKTEGIPNEAIDHSPHAIEIAQYTANFFVQEARKNFHKFSSFEEEDAALIDNYTPSKTTGSFMQTYFFHFK